MEEHNAEIPHHITDVYIDTKYEDLNQLFTFINRTYTEGASTWKANLRIPSDSSMLSKITFRQVKEGRIAPELILHASLVQNPDNLTQYYIKFTHIPTIPNRRIETLQMAIELKPSNFQKHPKNRFMIAVIGELDIQNVAASPTASKEFTSALFDYLQQEEKRIHKVQTWAQQTFFENIEVGVEQ